MPRAPTVPAAAGDFDSESGIVQEDIKLTGLARFSPRFHLLKRLAASDDPILSWVARKLVLDSASRRLGGVFEFLVAFAIPIFALMLSFLDGMHIIPYGYGSPIISLQSVSQAPNATTEITVLYWIACGGWLACGIPGFLLAYGAAVLPGVVLLKPDKYGDSLKLLSIPPRRIFNSLIKLQFASLFLPITFGGSIQYLLRAIEWNDPTLHGFYSMIGQQDPVLPNPFISLFFFLIAQMTVGLAGIFTSMKYKDIWQSSLALVVFQILFFAVMVICSGIILAFLALAIGPESIRSYGRLSANISFLLLSVVTYFLASRAVWNRVMPAK